MRTESLFEGQRLTQREARDALILAHLPVARSVARSLRLKTGREIDDADLEGISVLMLVRAADGFRPGLTEDTRRYLFRKTRNLAIDFLREYRHTRRKTRGETVQMQEWFDVPKSEDSSRKVLAREVLEAARGLPARWRKMLTLYYFEERTMDEVAEALGVNRSRVSQIHAAAIRKLRVALAGALEVM